MRTRLRPFLVIAGVWSVGVALTSAAFLANLTDFENSTGHLRTFNGNGAINLDHPFFQSLGSNGRSCATCHDPAAAWTITPQGVQQRFEASHGDDPIFRPNDGSNCNGVHTIGGEMAAAYSLLLSKGLIRVGIDLPAGAEFDILSVDDPYNCGGPLTHVSMYRRPLPAANLRFLSAVMWDGRESTPTSTIVEDLMHQANNATRGHAQATIDLTDEQQRLIVALETGFFTAQARDNEAADLAAQGGKGGPVHLARQPFFLGINDPIGFNPTGATFDPNVFTLFDAWDVLPTARQDALTEMRRSVARGQRIFNTRTFTIEGVGGLNGQQFSNGVRVPDSFTGTCSVCHDTPNAGNHSVKAPLNIGLAEASRRTPDLPLYVLINRSTGQLVETTDPGRAMISGKWADIGLFKGPVLRGLAARPPYFHNGSAATLSEVVDFYDSRFAIQFTPAEKTDLIAFLRAL